MVGFGIDRVSVWNFRIGRKFLFLFFLIRLILEELMVRLCDLGRKFRVFWGIDIIISMYRRFVIYKEF